MFAFLRSMPPSTRVLLGVSTYTVLFGVGASFCVLKLIGHPPVSVARDGFDCEILRVAREIEEGHAPDFVKLEAQTTRNGDNLILRALSTFDRTGSIPHGDVVLAYSTVMAERYRQLDRSQSILNHE